MRTLDEAVKFWTVHDDEPSERDVLLAGIKEIASTAYGSHLGEPGDPHAKGYAARRPIIDFAREVERTAADVDLDAVDAHLRGSADEAKVIDR